MSNTLELGLHAGAGHRMSWELNLCKCSMNSDLLSNL